VTLLDKFLVLPEERRGKIIAAAMRVFGAAGYKKAYTSEIAEEAGISKALVFHYFKCKKTLYLYLIEQAGKIMMCEFQAQNEVKSADFFDRIIEAAKLKLDIMSRYPAMTEFLTSVYYEDDPDVEQEVRALLSKGAGVRSEVVLSGADESKFKDGVDPKLVMNIIVKFTEGVVGGRLDKMRTIDEIMLEFTECVNLLRNNLYKKECL